MEVETGTRVAVFVEIWISSTAGVGVGSSVAVVGTVFVADVGVTPDDTGGSWVQPIADKTFAIAREKSKTRTINKNLPRA